MKLTEEEICETARRRYERDCKSDARVIYDEPGDVEYNARAQTVTLSNVRGELANYYVTPDGLRTLDELEATQSNPQRAMRRTLEHFART